MVHNIVGKGRSAALYCTASSVQRPEGAALTEMLGNWSILKTLELWGFVHRQPVLLP